jgi:copper(I)-binding protein
MTLDGDVMRMRARPALVLAAGQTLALQPGSWHLMLIGVAAPLRVGQTVPLWLTIETQAGQRYELAVQAPVRALSAAAQGHDRDAHHGPSHEGAGH